MPILSFRRQVLLLFALMLALSAAALAAYWFQRGRPVLLPDAVTAGHKLQCVSYTPFDWDESPLVPIFTVRPERVEADFELLSHYTDCVRTYSMTGMRDVPLIARKYGLKMMLGAWVNANPVDTRLEIGQLIDAANRYPDVVQSLVVGNEALLRKEISGAQLAQLITEVKSRVQQPVTYADVWEFWLKNPQVAPAVDFITIHLLPYWEDQPTGIDRALDHVAGVREEFVRRFAPKPIVIGETGWPSAGRQRETALPSRVNEARFIRSFVARARAEGWRYNLIEAFDQPWKRANEGAVGGYWGLFDSHREDKHVLAGPVSNLPKWQLWLAGSAAIAAGLLVLAGVPRERRGALLLPVWAALGGGCVAAWLQLGVVDCRDSLEWLWCWLLAALDLLVLGHFALALGSGRSWRGPLLRRLDERGGRWLLAAGFVGAVLMVELVFDPRYREFPTAALLPAALAYLGRPPRRLARREALLLAAVIACGIPLQLLQEGLRNTQALGWALICALLALALLVGVRTSRSNAATAANAAGVVV